MTPLRILHLPDLVGGMPTALAGGETSLGAYSKTLSYLDSPFGYQADMRLKHINAGSFKRWAERISKFFEIRGEYDVFHFNFGSSLLNSSNNMLRLADLPFYPASTARIMTYQGSDCRQILPPEFDESLQVEIGLGNLSADSNAGPSTSKLEEIRKSIAKVGKNCDQIYALNPDLLQFLPKQKAMFLPYAIDRPVIEEMDKKTPSWQSTKPLHIVHLSTNRVLKGSGIIEKALRTAQQKTGITYEVVFRQPRKQALAAMGRADLLIDQLVLGWYGATAIEAMYHKIPVAAYISPLQKQLAPQELVEELPIINCNSADIVSKIIELNSNRELLRQTAAFGEAFATKWHTPGHVARQTLSAYREILYKKPGSRFRAQQG